jgi:hypothetical protein
MHRLFFVASGRDSYSKNCANDDAGFEVFATVAIDVGNRWDEKAGLRRDAVRSQVIDVLEAQEIKETGNEEG